MSHKKILITLRTNADKVEDPEINKYILYIR